MSLLRQSILTSSAALALAATNASATWSILIADMRTGEIVIASATCVETIDLRRETPVLITGVGAVTAQSAVDITDQNRMLIRDRLLQGVPLESILDELAEFDSGHGNRQYGFITTAGDTLTYSGIQNANWAGGITGRIEKGRIGLADDIVYSVQGNILSGSNVVQSAVDAIINNDIDLPGRLMAAMQAAQVAGGDGRCSCSNAMPTGCGSPPPGPFKSAHVGYMLGARADDIDRVRGFYPITNLAGGMTIADLNHDSMPDVIIGDASIDEISIFMNSAYTGDPLSHVIKLDVRTVGASQTTAMSTADFDNDGYDDIAITLASPPTLAIMLGQASGELGEPITHPLPAIPTGLTTANFAATPFDGIAVSLGSIDSVQFFRLDNGDIIPNGDIAITGNPSAIIAADIVGNSDIDIIVARQDSNSVWIGENRNKDGFVEAANISTTTEPIKLAVADMDNDGDNELIVLGEAGQRVEVFDNDGKGWSPTNSIAINGNGRGLAVGTFDGDGFMDIITTSSSTRRNLQYFRNNGDGTLSIADSIKVGSGSRFVELIDMNNNDDLDIVIGKGEADGLMLIDNTRGAPLPQPGRFADGDYFLELNIANQRAGDPDPVDQLADQFNAWRAGLSGKVDAVQSIVQGRHRFESNTSGTITIELRDWQGALLPISDPGGWSLESSNNRFSASAPTLVEPGIFEFVLNAGEAVGQDQLVIRAGSPNARVRLMPEYGIFILENIADFTADGVLDFFDISAFLNAYFTNSPDADLDGNGSIDFNDVSLFLAAFKG